MFSSPIGAVHELRPYAVPLRPRPYRLTVGLRPTQRWLLPGPDTPAQVARKGQLLDTRAAQLVGVLPDFDAVQATLRAAEAVASAAIEAGVTLRAELVDLPAEHTPAANRTGATEAGLASVASSISEDICVMSRRSGQWRLVGAAVFFPSHWSPVGKLGGGLGAIHEPVPDYSRIAAATEQAFERIATSDGIWERFNWTLSPNDQLCHTAPATEGVGVTREPATAEELWLRVERQTLTALDRDLVVFLIRTFLTPLPQLVALERAALGEAVRGVSAELAEYRSWLGYREAVSRWAEGR